MKLRLRAILYALYFGILPYWCYEKKRHYNCSYWHHLVINVRYAWRWITFKEKEKDIEFEIKTNGKKA